MAKALLLPIVFCAASLAQTTHVSALCNMTVAPGAAAQTPEFHVEIKKHTVSNIKLEMASRPKRVMILQDTSGSTRIGNSQQLSLEAVNEFARLSPSADQLGLVDFNTKPYLDIKLEETSSFQKSLADPEIMKNMKRAGGTALYDAVAATIKHMQEDPHEGDSLFIISDLDDNDSFIGLKKLREVVLNAHVRIFVFMFGALPLVSSNRQGMVRLVRETGGLVSGAVPNLAEARVSPAFDPTYDLTPEGVAQLSSTMETVHRLIENPQRLEFDVSPQLRKPTAMEVTAKDANGRTIPGYGTLCPTVALP